jgi:sec-independent protein translocase protein TatA
MNTLAFLNSFGSWDMVIILVIALLLFGKRLPEVGRSLGKGITEFKKGLKGIEEDLDDRQSYPPPRQELPQDRNPYRPPLAEGGEDRRVSRAEHVESAPRDRDQSGQA